MDFNVEELVDVESITEEASMMPPKVGVVVNCTSLNIRCCPEPKGEVLCEVKALSELEIDEEQSTVEFYKVFTKFGIEGFCSKKFIAIRQ